jgi:hypothetical protein
VQAWKDARLALEKTVEPRHEAGERDRQLNVSVIFTSVEGTLAALRQAGALASSLGARITLLAPQVVPFPLPLESPPVLLDWSERRFQMLAAASPVPTTVRIYLCRDRVEMLASVLEPASVVVLGCRGGWWPSSETRLARRLMKTGHAVILTKTE